MAARRGLVHPGDMLRRLAAFCFVHRRITLLAWVMLVVTASLAASAAGGEYASGGRLPGTDSDRAYELLLQAAPTDPQIDGDTGRFVISDPAGFDDPGAAGRLTQYLADVAALPGVLDSPRGIEELTIAPEGTLATGPISLVTDDEAVVDELLDLRADLADQGTEVQYGGYRFVDGGVPSTEAFGLLAAMVILLIAFGSLVAMGLPILTALFGTIIGLAGVELWAAVVSTPDFTVQVASMVGIGVGIDYALFIVTRYREALHRGSAPLEAAVEAIDTAGRAVVFAGVTVMISLLGMLLMGMSFLNGLALGTSSAVLVAVLAALTLLPAALGFVGHRIERVSVHRRQQERGESGWHRWSRFVQRHPVASAGAGVVLLGLLVVPAFAMRFASADAGNDPSGSTTRLAYDQLANGFGAGYNGPLLVVTDLTDDPVSYTHLTLPTSDLV